MINLGRCLVYLLSRNDQVAVAGVGIFRCNRTPGYFDEVKQAFIASVCQIEFKEDREIGGETDLMVDYIAAQRQIGHSDAGTLYRNAIAALLGDLERDGRVELQGLGEIRREDPQLMFIPAAGGAFGRELPAVGELPVLAARSGMEAGIEAEIGVVAETGVVAGAGIEVEVETQPAVVAEVRAGSELGAEVGLETEAELEADRETTAYEEESDRRGSFWRSALIVLVFLAAVYASLWYLRPDLLVQGRNYLTSVQQKLPAWLGGQGQEQKQGYGKDMPGDAPVSAVPVLIPDSAQYAQDSLQMMLSGVGEGLDSLQTDQGLITEPENAGAANTLNANSRPGTPSVSFEIIVGSFATMQQADQFVAEMKAKGIEVWAIDSRMPGNRKKVSCGSFPTQAAAYRALKEFQRTIEPGAWVARVEK